MQVRTEFEVGQAPVQLIRFNSPLSMLVMIWISTTILMNAFTGKHVLLTCLLLLQLQRKHRPDCRWIRSVKVTDFQNNGSTNFQRQRFLHPTETGLTIRNHVFYALNGWIPNRRYRPVQLEFSRWAPYIQNADIKTTSRSVFVSRFKFSYLISSDEFGIPVESFCPTDVNADAAEYCTLPMVDVARLQRTPPTS